MVLRLLQDGWDNEGWSGDYEYLYSVWSHSLQARRILECGSGLSTIVLGEVASKTGAEIWSFEHEPSWQNKVNSFLARRGVSNRVVLTPLKNYGNFDWYELPSKLPTEFDLVVCDGPPGNTKGGRYGLLPVCAKHISRATILLDDVDRSSELEVMHKWEDEFGFQPQIQCNRDRAFAILRRNSAQHKDGHDQHASAKTMHPRGNHS